jgi:hypothetical protein
MSAKRIRTEVVIYIITALIYFAVLLWTHAGLPLDGAVLRSPLDGGGQAVTNALLKDCLVVSGGPFDRDYFSLTSTPFSTSYTGHLSGVTVTNQDRIETLYSTFNHKGRQLLPWAPYAETNAVYLLSSSATNVTLDTNTLQVSFTSAGTADVTVVNGSFSRTLTLDSADSYLYTNRYIYGGVTGSLRHALSAAFDAALSNTNAAVYSVQDHANTNYVRSTNCWVHGLVDLSCASPWNSFGGQTRAGTAISPRHIIYAKHYSMPTGTVLRFIDSTNGVHARTLVDYNYPAVDIAVGLLDSDLPATIVPAKALKDTRLEDWLPTPGRADVRLNDLSRQIPVVFLNRQEHAYVGEWSGRLWIGGYIGAVKSAAHADRSAHYSTPVGGDSGNPVMMVLGTNPVLITTWHYASGGPSVRHYAPQIESAMQALGGGYTNLSYVNYGDYDQVTTNGPPEL